MSFTQGVFLALPGSLSSKQPPAVSHMAVNGDCEAQLICFLSQGSLDFSLADIHCHMPPFNAYIFSDFLLLSSGKVALIPVSSS